SAQFSPRVIARVFRDPYTKIALAVFVFAYTYSLVVLSRLEQIVYLISGVLCGYGTLACLAVFLLLIDRLGKELRPVRILTTVAAEGREVIRSIYPQLLTQGDGSGAPDQSSSLGKLTRVIDHHGGPSVVLAIDDKGLLKIAQK